MPILVVTILSASANASFYIAWMIAGFLVMVPFSLTTVLYALESGEDSRPGERFPFTLKVSLLFGVAANLVLLPGAEPLLSLFGADYAEDATSLLHLMALGVFPLTIKTHYVALRRLERRLGTALPVVWAGTALELGGGALGAVVGGLQGVALGWLAGLCIEALVMGPAVLRALRSGVIDAPPPPPDAPTAALDAAVQPDRL